MITLICISIMIAFIWLIFKILPAIIGFSFTVFVAILQIIGFLFLLPLMGILFFLVDVLVIGAIVGLIKIII